MMANDIETCSVCAWYHAIDTRDGITHGWCNRLGIIVVDNSVCNKFRNITNNTKNESKSKEAE